MAQTWNVKFEFLDGSYSVSNIQDYIKYVIKKHKTSTNPIFLIYLYLDQPN